MLRLGEDVIHRARLHHLTEIHHRDAIGEVANHIKVMADEHVGEPLLRAEVGE